MSAGKIEVSGLPMVFDNLETTVVNSSSGAGLGD